MLATCNKSSSEYISLFGGKIWELAFSHDDHETQAHSTNKCTLILLTLLGQADEMTNAIGEASTLRNR